MQNYTAEVEVTRRDDLTHDELDAAMGALAEYGPSIGTAPRGYLSARLTFPAASVTQAASTAASVVAAALGSEVLRLEVMPEAEADRREHDVALPELVAVAEAAEMLNVSAQRIRQMIGEGKIAAHRVGERSWAIVRAEVEAMRPAAA